MTDVHSKTTRSYNMSRIRAKNTRPELLLRKFLFSQGFRYRLHSPHLPGKPDIVLPKYKTVIFVNGCFWHGHANCRYFVVPQARRDWWLAKIEGNRANDRKKRKQLRQLGWTVLSIWECQLRPKKLRNTELFVLGRLK